MKYPICKVCGKEVISNFGKGVISSFVIDHSTMPKSYWHKVCFESSGIIPVEHQYFN